MKLRVLCGHRAVLIIYDIVWEGVPEKNILPKNMLDSEAPPSDITHTSETNAQEKQPNVS